MIIYCVLWIPTAFHKRLVPTSGLHEKEVDISDIENKPHKVKVKLDEKENVVITSVDDKHNVILTLIESSSNGLFLYEYEINGEKNPLVGEEVQYAIYHIVKEFYHVHEHHDPEEDAHLTPYCSKKKPQIRTQNNEALIHYLKNYQEKFSAYLHQLRFAYEGLKVTKQSPKNAFFVSTKSYKEIIRLCTKARGEELYYNSLNKSKYNTLCKAGQQVCISENVSEKRENGVNESDLSKIAFNIENTLENIKLIESKILHDYNFESSKISVNIAWLALSVGIILGLISIVLGAIPFFKTDKTLPKFNEQKVEIEQIIANQSIFDKKVDTLTYKIKAIENGSDNNGQKGVNNRAPVPTEAPH